MAESFRVERQGASLVGERRTGSGPTMAFLHAGVTDRRSWQQVIGVLDAPASVVTYDRRGFREMAPSEAAFSHIEDLEELCLPVLVACGEFDVPFLVHRARELAERVAGARHRVLRAVAHLPQLEQPAMVAELVQSAVDGN